MFSVEQFIRSCILGGFTIYVVFKYRYQNTLYMSMSTRIVGRIYRTVMAREQHVLRILSAGTNRTVHVQSCTFKGREKPQ